MIKNRKLNIKNVSKNPYFISIFSQILTNLTFINY